MFLTKTPYELILFILFLGILTLDISFYIFLYPIYTVKIRLHFLCYIHVIILLLHISITRTPLFISYFVFLSVNWMVGDFMQRSVVLTKQSVYLILRMVIAKLQFMAIQVCKKI